jgi:hypothetical protein
MAVCSGGSAGRLQGDYSVKGHVGEHDVVFTAHLNGLAGSCRNPESWVWGSDQECPEQFVSSVAVTWASRPIFVPASAYLDLASVRSATINPSKNGFTITLKGGDAATSYSAVLQFAGNPLGTGGFLAGRVVRSGEFPEDAWEETTYHFHGGGE